MYADCPECRKPMVVEYVDVGMAYYVWHGVHCGLGHEIPADNVRHTREACTCDPGLMHEHRNYCEIQHPYHRCYAETCRFYDPNSPNAQPNLPQPLDDPINQLHLCLFEQLTHRPTSAPGGPIDYIGLGELLDNIKTATAGWSIERQAVLGRERLRIVTRWREIGPYGSDPLGVHPALRTTQPRLGAAEGS